MNSRTTALTSDALKEYKEMIQLTSCDLEMRLQNIDNKVSGLRSQTGERSNQMSSDRQRIEEEKKSIKQCLDICSQVSNHIDELHPGALKNDFTTAGQSRGAAALARQATACTLMKCRNELEDTGTRLRDHLRHVDERLSHPSVSLTLQSNGGEESRKRLSDERSSLLKSIELCEKAAKEANRDRQNVYEDIKMAEDGCQMIVSTVGELITAHNITAGPRSTQVLGQLSDDSLQQISQDHQAVYIQHPSKANEAWSKSFEIRHGAGRNL